MSNRFNTLLRGTAIVGSLTVLSRILGFARDLLVARLFGAGLLADAFHVAFRVPNLLRSLVAEGAFTSGFVPIFAGELKKGHADAQETLRSVFTVLLILTTALTVLGIVFATEIVGVIAPGFSARYLPDGTSQAALCAWLLQIMIGYIVCISAVVMINGTLNSVKVFGISAFAQIIMNFVLIVGALVAGLFEDRVSAYVLAGSVLIGGILQVLAQVPALRRAGFSLTISTRMLTAPVWAILRLMAPAVLGAAVYQISQIISTILASFLVVGSISWLFYADRIAQLPIGIFSVALSSVLLPTLSIANASSDKEAFAANLVNALRFTSFVVLPISCFLFLFANPLVKVLFERGAFDSYATMQTAFAIQAMVFGIWAVSCHSLLVRAFVSKRDTTTPVIISVLTLLFTSTLAIALMGPPTQMQDSVVGSFIVRYQNFLGSFVELPALGFLGLAISSTLGAFFSLCFSGVLIQRRVADLPLGAFLTATIKSSLACLVMLLGVVAILPPELDALTKLLLGTPIALILFIGFAWLLKTKELHETFALFWRYLDRGKRSRTKQHDSTS